MRKIVIVGGGVAGAILAKELSSFDVTLIQDRVWDKPCGGGVKTKVFSQFNLSTSLIKHKLSYIYMNYKKDKIKIDLKGENLSIVLREEFDEYLRNRAKKSGVKLVYGRFKDVENKTAIVKVKDKIEKFQFDILIGADGVNSTVRKVVGLEAIPYTLTHYARIDKVIDSCEFYFDEEIGGEYYAWEFPHQNRTHIGSVSRENFNNLIRYLNVNISPKGYKIPTWQENITIKKDNFYFVGDAAGQVMPLSFEGIYYAMHSAKILADSIKNNLDYQKEWNRRFLREFKFMKRLESINKTFLRKFVVKAHKFKFVRDFSVSLWLGERNV